MCVSAKQRENAGHKSPLDDPPILHEIMACYQVKYSDTLGRYLTATRDIEAGEVVLDEFPLIIGPKQATPPVCLGCYAPVDGSYTCSQCGWPLCHAKCQDSADHQSECAYFQRKGLTIHITDFGTDSKLYDAITPLRCALLKESAPESYDKLRSMMSHAEQRHKSAIWSMDQSYVVNVIRRDWQGDEFAEADLHEICGILEVNAFEVVTSDPTPDTSTLAEDDEIRTARALGAESCLLSHNCVPNVVCNTENPRRLRFTAAVTIPAGTIIATSYTYPLDNTRRRRQHLKQTKFFHCLCDRCVDPTELGTHLGSLTCPECAGIMTAKDARDANTPWQCQACSYGYPSHQVEGLEKILQAEADAIDYDDVAEMEEFLVKTTKYLHPNHAILTGVKYYLCFFYGNFPGYTYDEFNDTTRQRKINLCNELLQLAGVLEPGKSKLVSVLQKELKAARSSLNKQNLGVEGEK